MQIIDPSYWFVKVILSFTGIYNFSCSLLDFAWNPAFFAPPLLPKKKRISLKIYCFSMTSPYYVLNACCVSCFCLKCLRFYKKSCVFCAPPCFQRKSAFPVTPSDFFPQACHFCHMAALNTYKGMLGKACRLGKKVTHCSASALQYVAFLLSLGAKTSPEQQQSKQIYKQNLCKNKHRASKSQSKT